MNKSRDAVSLKSVIIRFAGDSGDGIQIIGDQFTDTSAWMGNDIATLPNFPAEIQAPAGTLPGVSSFQVQIADHSIHTPGDQPDVLVAMNPAGLKTNIRELKAGGLLLINENSFTENNLKKSGWVSNPLEDQSLSAFHLVKIPMTDLTKNASSGIELSKSDIERSKNFFALGFLYFLYERKPDQVLTWLEKKFSTQSELLRLNKVVFQAGYNFGEISEYELPKVIIEKNKLPPGTYRRITGNQALALGLAAAANLSGRKLFFGAYPITPASSVLHQLTKFKDFNVISFQAEDEMAAAGAALGASYGGHIGVCATSGPGLCLKSEMIGLAVMAELPLVILDIQRAGPSTGMPTKFEQSDLLLSLYGRHGEAPCIVLAPRTPSECFSQAVEAVRLAVKYMCPVILLSDGYIANCSEVWKLPALEELKPIEIKNHSKEDFEGSGFAYQREETTLGRPWIVPGTAGLEHRIGGLSKEDKTGNISYDPQNNEKMARFRADKVLKAQQDIADIEVRGQGDVLILGWGGTYGSLYSAWEELTRQGRSVAFAQLSAIMPFPKNLDSELSQFKKVLIPELNFGQLLTLIHHYFPSVKAVGINKLTGQPFMTSELVSKVIAHMEAE